MKKFIKNFSIIAVLFLVSAAGVYSQNKGSISGKVYDGTNGELLRRATVAVKDTKKGTFTDVKGEYRIKDLNPGKYTLIVRYVGFKPNELKDIEVKSDENTEINFTLESSIKSTEEIVITANRENGNEAAILAQRKNASELSDGVSIEEIKRTPDSDAGQSLRRVSGVTLVNDKFVYVRGVSERYSNTLLNGTSLATTEPDKKAFAFDMFPSEFLENANVSKSFTPDMPGNFAGGLVQLNTIDFPSKFSLKLSSSASMTEGLTGQNKFITYSGGKTDWLGFDDGTRSIPNTIPSSPIDMKKITSNLKSSDESLLIPATQKWNEFGNSFDNKVWNRDTVRTPFNGSITLSYTDLIQIDDNDFGIIASAMYGNTYSYTDIYRATLNSDGSVYNYNGGGLSTYSTNMGGMLNMAYKIGTHSSVSWKNTYNHSSDDESTILEGKKDQNYIKQYGFQFVQKSLFSSQLGAEHTIPFYNSLLDWKIGYSKSARDEPDFRRVRYSRNDLNEPYRVDIYDLEGNSYQAGRFFSNLSEDALSGAFNYTLPIDNMKFKTGVLYENKARDFKVRSFNIVKGTYMVKEYYDEDFGYVLQNYGDDEFYNNSFTLSPDELFGNPDNYNYGRLGISEDTKPTDSYKASEGLFAGYMMADVPFMIGDTKIRIVAGARIESSNQQLNSYYNIAENGGDSNYVDRNFTDILPSLNVIYELNKEMNLRASASQTLTRPSLREYAPFTFYDFQFQGDVTGNQNLTRALIQNYDLRWEYYPNPGEALSVSTFYKTFQNAIEETIIGTSSNFKKTFDNAQGTAYNYGIELEARKNLRFISDWTKYFSFNLNLAFIRSEITVKQVNNKDTRAMWGQSPYTLNIGLFYYNPEIGTALNFGYNVAGKRIIQVADISKYDIKDPHVYEMPRHVLDFSFSQVLFKNIELKFNAKDILNENTEWKQLGKTVSRNMKGRGYSLGFGYKL